MASPETDILERAQAGDRRALSALFEPEVGRVYATCRRMIGNPDDAAEVAQDAMVRAIRGIGTCAGRSAFSTWLTRVTINTCLSWHRARGRRKGRTPIAIENADVFADPRGAELSARGGVQPGYGADAALVARRLDAALEEISPEHRAVLVLRDVRGLEYDAIGAALDLPLGTVKSRLYRARAALRAALEAGDGRADGMGEGRDSDRETDA